MGFWLIVDSNKTLQRKSCVLAAVAELGESLFAEGQNSFSSAFGSLLAYNFALLLTKEENTTVVVVHDMELVCACPTLNSPEQAFLKKEVFCTQIMVLVPTLQKIATPTLHPQLPCFCLWNHKANCPPCLWVSCIWCEVYKQGGCGAVHAWTQACTLPWAPGQVWSAGRRALSQSHCWLTIKNFQSIPRYNWLVQTSYLAYGMSDLLHLPCPPCPRPHPLYHSMIWHIPLELQQGDNWDNKIGACYGN